MLVDSVALILTLILSFSVRLGYWYWPENNLIWAILGSPIIAIPIFRWFGLYKEIIRYIGINMLWVVARAVSLYALVWGIVGFMVAVEGIPRSVVFINWLFAFVIIGGLRVSARSFLSTLNTNINAKCKNVVIYGAGSAGRQLSIALAQSSEYNPVAFIDDASDIQKHSIGGIEIVAPDSLEILINSKSVTEVLLAIPSISNSRRKDIINFLQPYSVHVRSLPGVSELAQGKVKIADLQEISITDLLGREPALADKGLLSLNVESKVIMVTGAGGSIGSELCRQIFLLKPKMLILYELSEFALYKINRELLDIALPSIKLLPILGSVNNKNRLTRIFNKFNVQTVYHAAAYKHVPMVEFNNTEGVNNNIFGTINCAQAAIDTDVDTFVLISTDKAVRPTNTMGATKRFAEMVLQAFSVKQSRTRFTMVRFGNVLGSSGSVIPLFTKQIINGGPVTVTDPNIVRYFMTAPEAVELVIQAGAMGSGGDVFVLDMGDPIRILDLAKKMISLSGLDIKDDANPNGDIEIKFSGLRPGEKLYEELLIGDNTSSTDNPMIMRAQEDMLDWKELNTIIENLEEAAINCRPEKIRELLLQAVPEFKPQCDIADILYKQDSAE